MVCIGDKVLMNRGRESGTIHAIIDSTEAMAAWGHEETGLVIDVATSGLNFWPEWSLRSFNDEIRFISSPMAGPDVSAADNA